MVKRTFFFFSSSSDSHCSHKEQQTVESLLSDVYRCWTESLNFITYFECTMEFVISILQCSINVSITSIIVNKSFVCVLIISWLAIPFVELKMSISELLVSFITSEVETIKSCVFPCISNHLKCFSLQQLTSWLSSQQPFQTFSIMKPLCGMQSTWRDSHLLG